MLLDLPSHDLIPILTSEEVFRVQVDAAVEIINAAEGGAASASASRSAAGGSSPQFLPPAFDFGALDGGSGGSSSAGQPAAPLGPYSIELAELMAGTPLSESGESAPSTQTTPLPPPPPAEDNAPLFYQPGPRGFYSPRLGRGTEARLNAFRNVGRIIGICFVQNELCPITLNRHVIKYILGRPIAWHDLAFFDSDLYESLRQLVLDAEGPNREEFFADLDFRFSIDVSAEEGSGEVELLPGGRHLRVTPGNVLNYVQRYAMHRMLYSALGAIQALKAGIFDVLPARSFDGLTVSFGFLVLFWILIFVSL